MLCLNKVEKLTAVANIYGSASQFVVKGSVVKHIEILQHNQLGGLVVWVLCHQFAQFVKRLLIKEMRIVYEFF